MDRDSKVKVIVRAWGDEPVILYVFGTDRDRMKVGGEFSRHPIGIPCNQVFGFDAKHFEKLSQMHRAGDKQLLAEMWNYLVAEGYSYEITSDWSSKGSR